MHVVSLVGEQPLPSLTVLRFLKPLSFTLVCTEYTRKVAERIAELVEATHKLVFEIPAYRLVGIRERLERHLNTIKQDLDEEKIAFDLTGGTKLMALAAYDVARSHASSVYYLRSQKETLLLEYKFTPKGIAERLITIPEALFDLMDYFLAYLGSEFKITGPCRDEPGRSFEMAVAKALKDVVDELEAGIKFGGALDLDLAFRLGTRVGVAELKTGEKAKQKRPLEQVNAACGREFLGIYTKKFLIVDREIGSNLHELARAWNVKVVELPSFGHQRSLSPRDEEKLKQEVRQHLGG